MRKLAVALCLLSLLAPAHARRRYAFLGGHGPSLQPAGTIQPASTGFSFTGPVPNRTLNSGYGVRRGYGRRYYRGYYANGYSSGNSLNGGIPGYDTPLPQRTLPGY
ncbi:MAG: hypothetical protein J0I12_09750 [Candidatus Eremiobacteraeota bacterium]|nr:hypothetical protein [Candidatus Eremiobacteraeota bacterium]